MTKSESILLRLMTAIVLMTVIGTHIGAMNYEKEIEENNEKIEQYEIEIEYLKTKIPQYNPMIDGIEEEEETNTTVINDPEPEYVYWDGREYEEFEVQAGNTYWGLAERYYGNGIYWPQIEYDNGLQGKELLIGKILKIYPLDLDKIEEIEASRPKKATTSIRNNTSADTSGMTYLGSYRITGYDPYCAHCCTTTNGITASGRPAEIGTTCALNGVKFGTRLYIEGYGYYRVDDTGNMNRTTIDIACHNHDECYAITRNNVNVYLVG